MLTPAEIIAARVLNAQDDNGSVSDSDETSSILDYNEASSLSNSVPSLSDESAFPTLGGKKSSISSSTPSWGPSMKAPVSNVSPKLSAKANSKSVNSNFKVSTIQEAFSLDAEDQLNVARPEFIKILTSVKSETKTNIECTTSHHTKKRTFLITGKLDDVKQAKRLIIKKLTKPVKISFSVPALVRSKIIGPQGRILKPIIQENEVKIDIGNVEDSEEPIIADDDKMIKIIIDGDVEGCKHAKHKILSIVKEETKNLSLSIGVDDSVKPFVEKELKHLVNEFKTLDISIPDFNSPSSKITIIGERELVLQAKERISEKLVLIESKIVSEEVPIPTLKHQFLLIDEILDEFNVLIKLPVGVETSVRFVGEKSKIALAKEKARQTTSQYKVEVLEMSKAHKGNLDHVKAVASLLSKNGVFAKIAADNEVLINTPTQEELSNSETVSIPIEIVVKDDKLENIKTAKKSIVSVVNKVSPSSALVIKDVDSFLIPKVPEILDEAIGSQNVSYVIIGNNITLFADEVEEEDGEDFVDSSDDSELLSKINSSLNTLRELASSLGTVVLQIPATEQDIVLGANGTTLNLILSSVEKNSVLIKTNWDGNIKSENNLYIHGIKSEVEKVCKDIERVLSEYKEFKNSYKTSIEVPRSILSRLIGKNGASMNALRDEFAVSINIAGDEQSVNDSDSKCEIFITGAKRNSDECKAKIETLSKRWSDETLVRLKIENQYHRRMIGSNGIYINRLQDKYNVKIRFPSEKSANFNFSDSPKSRDEVTIKGPSKGVAKAEEELKELYQFEKENGFKQTVQIPIKAISRVIGKSGETINDIADGCGIEYQFKRNSESEEALGYAEVELTGSKTALKEANQKIQKIIDEAENFVSVSINVNPKYHRGLIGQGGAFMRDIISKAGGDDVPRSMYFRLLTIPNEGSGSDVVTSEGNKVIVNRIIEQIKEIIAKKEASVSVEYDLAKEKHRFIVGPAGSIRHSLQDEFDVSIDIPRPSDVSSIIKLNGLPENIEKLIEKLNTLTKDDWNVCIEIPETYHSLVSERGAIFKRLKSDFDVEVHHGNLTRKAAKLSSTPIPSAPTSAYPTDGEVTKFTIDLNAFASTSDESSELIPWRLKGDVQNTEKAAQFIRERLEIAKKSDATGWFYSKNPSSFHKIVGTQGSKVNQIRKKSNTFITIPRQNDKNSNFIYLVGTEGNLNIAKNEIESLI